MADIIEIENVPKDVDPTAVGTVKNPLDEEFSCIYDGKNVIRIKPGGKVSLPLPIAIHAAKHLAERIVWKDHEETILKRATTPEGKVDETILNREQKMPIANYQAKVWEAMKKVTKSDSKFFKDEDAQRKAQGKVERTDKEKDLIEIGKEEK